MSNTGIEPAGDPSPPERSAQASNEIRAEFLRARIERHLLAQGFALRNGRLIAPVPDKDQLRDLHRGAVDDARAKARRALERHEPWLVKRLVAGSVIDPASIDPVLVTVDGSTSRDALLWRWCSLHWSIPVSAGYGRRLRFLVVDRAHDDAVIGIIGLADPVYSLAARDTWVGWTREQRATNLANIMDAFVLGAVPPYSNLLGGKLVALLAGSSEVRQVFAERYGHRRTLIADRDPNATLAMITTTSAFGRSSIYNRLTWPDHRLAYRSVGFTKGTGDFHLSGALYHELVSFARDHTSAGDTQRHSRWRGKTFRNRREAIQRALDLLGLDGRALRIHGIRREIFCVPLAENSREWLRGEHAELHGSTPPIAKLSAWWRTRWALPRARTRWASLDFEPTSWQLWPASDEGST